MKKILKKEIKRKTQIYGVTAILVVIVFSSLIFTLGTNPNITPFVNPPAASAIQTFADETELRNYITTNAQGPITAYRGSSLDTQFFEGKGFEPLTPEPSPSIVMEAADSGSQSNSYSITNIQVAGVDEATRLNGTILGAAKT